MFNLSLSDPSKLIETIAPISMENLQKSFSDNEVAFVIDYENSLMKGRQLLVYLGNLEVPCDIKFSDKVTKTERFDLLVEYMNFRNLIGCETLAITVATVLTAIKDIDDFYHVVENPMLDHLEIVEFIQEHQILVNTWRVFMDSMLVFTMCSSKKFVEAFGDPKQHYPNVDDANIVGNNVVQLFDIPMFLELYYSVPGTEFYYFTKQFEDYMFAAQNLFYYFFVEGNPLPMILEMMGSVEYNVEDLEASLTEQEQKHFEE